MRVYQFVVYHIHRSWRFSQGSPRGCPVTTERPVLQCSPLTRWLSSPSVSVRAIKAFCFLKRLGDNMMLSGIQVGIYWLSNLFLFWKNKNSTTSIPWICCQQRQWRQNWMMAYPGLEQAWMVGWLPSSGLDVRWTGMLLWEKKARKAMSCSNFSMIYV